MIKRKIGEANTSTNNSKKTYQYDGVLFNLEL